MSLSNLPPGCTDRDISRQAGEYQTEAECGCVCMACDIDENGNCPECAANEIKEQKLRCLHDYINPNREAKGLPLLTEVSEAWWELYGEETIAKLDAEDKALRETNKPPLG